MAKQSQSFLFPQIAFGLLLNLVFISFTCAHDIPIPGSKFNRAEKKKPKAGAQANPKHWQVDGKASWVELGPKKFGIQLSQKATLKTSVQVSAPSSKKKGGKIEKPEFWGAIASVVVSSKEKNGQLRVALKHQNNKAINTKSSIQQGPSEVWVYVSPEKMLDGTWDISIQSSRSNSVIIEAIRWARVPVNPEGMKFAKPNGFNGPDRLESGSLGFVGHTAHKVSPLPVHSIRKGGPAEKAGLQAGDVIVAVNGSPLPVNSCAPGHGWFKDGHEAVLGRATQQALSQQDPTVGLSVFRGNKLHVLNLRIEPHVPLPENFPFDEEATPKLYEDLLSFLRKTRKKNGTWNNGGNRWVQTSIAGLALLGRRDPQDRLAIKEIADWFLETFAEPSDFTGFSYWPASYSGIFLMEYGLATGDPRIALWAERALRWVEFGTHTSKWGTAALGHGPSGLPYGQKALMAPCSHLIVFEALAKRMGVKSNVWEKLYPYMKASWSDPAKGGHGSIGYNPSYKDKGEFWSRTGLFGLAASLRGVEPEMCQSLASFMRKRHAWMRNSHAYGYPGDAWGLIGLSQLDPSAFQHVMSEWRWAFDGAWQPGYGLRHTTAHMGSPYMGGEGLINPAMAALLSVRHKGLVITGAVDYGWLDVSDLPTRPSAVHSRREKDGRVSLRAVLGGNAIHYTLDGSEPTLLSPKYVKSIAMPNGGIISARTISSSGKLSPVAKFQIGIPKVEWKIIQPEGAAAARAEVAIDSDPDNPWRNDNGHEQGTFPLSLVIDLGSVQKINGLILSGSNGKQFEVYTATDRALLKKDQQPIKQEFSKKKAVQKIEFKKLRSARFVKLVAVSAFKKAKHLVLGEVDLLWPELSFKKGPSGKLSIYTNTPELSIRYSIDGKAPTAESKLYQNQQLSGKWIQARLFDSVGAAVGPVRGYRIAAEKL